MPKKLIVDILGGTNIDEYTDAPDDAQAVTPEAQPADATAAGAPGIAAEPAPEEGAVV